MIIAAVQPFNRKYLGSKRLLGPWICGLIREAAGTPRSFLDGFCGTGAVGVEMSLSGAARVIAVDSLQFNCVILRAFCGGRGSADGRATTDAPLRGEAECIEYLNGLTPMEGYISESFAGTYFTRENCARMDAMREEIAALGARGEISPVVHDRLLAAFLLAADRTANTLGQYDAFLKNIDAEKAVLGGRHLVDQRVRSPFLLKPLAVLQTGEMEVIAGDLLRMPAISVEAAYFDPPYNGRQYCDNYHVLENLARWEKPPLYGKTKKFDRRGMQSPFSRRSEAAPALRALMERTDAAHVFLSYSSEGILSREVIVDILRGFGDVRLHVRPYPVFGNGAGSAKNRRVTEYLFHLTRRGG